MKLGKKQHLRALITIVLLVTLYSIASTKYTLQTNNHNTEQLPTRALLVHNNEGHHAHAWNDKQEPAQVPKLLHFIILGDAPHEHMLKFVEFNTKVAIDHGFKVMLWRDDDAEKLVQRHDTTFNGRLSQSWEYVKLDRGKAKYARMADFTRVLILYAMGGVYLDADFIMCDGVDFMADTPGVVSFPFKTVTRNSREIMNSIMAAPSHHRLFELALENFIAEGPAIGSKVVLDAVGPRMISKITDQYFKEVGVDLASISDGYSPFSAQPVDGVIDVKSDDFWEAKVADVRFAVNPRRKGLYHVAFRSWFPEKKLKERQMMMNAVLCFEDSELISPFLVNFCRADTRGRIRINDKYLSKCKWTA